VQSAGGVSLEAPIIAAGAGVFVIERISARQNRRCFDFASLMPVELTARGWSNICAPAAAVALLLAKAADGRLSD
jgi:hypothetical protein